MSQNTNTGKWGFAAASHVRIYFAIFISVLRIGQRNIWPIYFVLASIVDKEICFTIASSPFRFIFSLFSLGLLFFVLSFSFW